VGKGLSGGTITIRPMTASPLVSHENVIVGNTVLYGATAGRLFAAGQAGERFAVRNSGAVAVVEGCGSNGCEYMTGGVTVILGEVGDNFAAGMTGGMAFVYDPAETLPIRINSDTALYQRVESAHWEKLLRDLVEEHQRETQSRFAEQLLVDWQRELGHFWQVVPREMIDRLEQPLSGTAAEQRA
jgi:glutamate synthase (NADPH/NADH) large chain